MTIDVRDLASTIATETGCESRPIIFSSGEWHLETEEFALKFALYEQTFEVRSINSRDNDEVHHQVIEAIHKFAKDQHLEVYTADIRDDAFRF